MPYSLEAQDSFDYEGEQVQEFGLKLASGPMAVNQPTDAWQFSRRNYPTGL